MTLYLTDNTSPDEIYKAKEQGIVALKMYPAGATTNSDSGVTDWRLCVETLKTMEKVWFDVLKCCALVLCMFLCVLCTGTLHYYRHLYAKKEASFVIVSTCVVRVTLIPFGGKKKIQIPCGVNVHDECTSIVCIPKDFYNIRYHGYLHI